MQTFLPYASFLESAACLDNKRLGKQRVEARQIYDIITGNAKSNAWANHPAVRMWRATPEALALYHDAVIITWVERGFRNSMPLLYPENTDLMPAWLGNTDFHESHQSNLLRKDYEYYAKQLATALTEAAKIREESWDETIKQNLDGSYYSKSLLDSVHEALVKNDLDINLTPLIYASLRSCWNESLNWAERILET